MTGSTSTKDAQSLTAALNGKWHGRYGLACCPAHGDRRPSLSLADGDDGRLLLNCMAGCSFNSVLTTLRERGLIGGHQRPQPLNAAETAQREMEQRAEAERAERKALATWREAMPIRGTIAERYLRGRGITCGLPDTLRFHPECWHPTARRFPAMVALIEGLPRLAIHRTYLHAAGSKADIEPNKAMQGAASGGAVRLSSEGGQLVVAEGIETALSLRCGLLSGLSTVWAALSCAGISNLLLPPRPGRLIIAPDGDDPGQAAANKLAERAYAKGWEVSLLPAPQGRDWNDILNMKGPKA